jgi:zinc protease
LKRIVLPHFLFPLLKFTFKKPIPLQRNKNMALKKSLLVVASILVSTAIHAGTAVIPVNNSPGKIKLKLVGKPAASPVKINTLKQMDVAGAGSVVVPNIKPADVFRDYLKAIGGMEVLTKVKSLYMLSGMQIQGTDLQVELKAMTPNLEVMTMSAGGNVVMKSKFDGTSGFTELNGNKKPFTEQEVKEKTVLTGLVEQLDYLKNPAFIAEVKGIEKVNGSDAYKINITYPSGKVKSEFYDLNSKLLVKKEEMKTENFQTTTTSQVYSNYKMVGNIYFPFDHTLIISTNGEKQILEMKASVVKINEGVTAADFK